MSELWDRVVDILSADIARDALRAAAILLVGLLLAKAAGRKIRTSGLRAQQSLLLRRIGGGLIIGVSVAMALSELGLNLGVLLGAAGVLTVAIGFASQTSVSNVISGVFLMGEQPFQLGDTIIVDGETGIVLSIDLISVKLRTFDNRMVRIPNETMVKSKVINVTRFPIRRYDMMIGVAYKEDIGKVREVLAQVADDNVLCLQEPAPVIIFRGFGESSLDLQFSVWSTQETFLELRNTMHEQVKHALDAAGIEIPFPHLTVYTGSETAPMPVALVRDRPL